jgi:hypothetical protein
MRMSLCSLPSPILQLPFDLCCSLYCSVFLLIRVLRKKPLDTSVQRSSNASHNMEEGNEHTENTLQTSEHKIAEKRTSETVPFATHKMRTYGLGKRLRLSVWVKGNGEGKQKGRKAGRDAAKKAGRHKGKKAKRQQGKKARKPEGKKARWQERKKTKKPRRQAGKKARR